jgi:His/Glu/Gln/Arg/opine family amino acid ABC transporter permease subunit
MSDIGIGVPRTSPPEVALPSPRRWIRDNLFSSVTNTVQTLVFTVILLGLLRWALGLVFAEDTNWAAVATNMRLLFTYNYPTAQYGRVWVVTGTILLAMGASFGAWNFNAAMTVRRLGVSGTGTGAFLLVIGVITPTSTPTAIRVWILIIGVALVAISLSVLRLVDQPHHRQVSFAALLTSFGISVVVLLWLFPFGNYGFTQGAVYAEPGLVAASTRVPWTVLILIMLSAFFAGRFAVRRLDEFGGVIRSSLIVFWVVGPLFLVFLVLRDPEFDMGYVMRVDIPIAAGFILLGAVLISQLAQPARAEIARVVGAVLLAFAVFNWIAGFMGWYPMLQKVRISFALVALLVLLLPGLAGERAARLRLMSLWAVAMVILHWLITGMNTPSTLEIAAPPFLGGFVLTVTIAFYVMLASFPIGVLLALARTSKLPIFRVLATAYIEVIRGVPLITVLFFFSIMLPLFLPRGMGISDLAAVFAGYAVFSAAYMAENIRGGLQSVRRGQFEAADALGLTAMQRTGLIVLPQALRVSIPNLVGQAIATFKETSLIAIVGGFDLLRIANATIPNQPDFLGQKRPGLLFISLIYFVCAYTMSRASQNLETRLGSARA